MAKMEGGVYTRSERASEGGQVVSRESVKRGSMVKIKNKMGHIKKCGPTEKMGENI